MFITKVKSRFFQIKSNKLNKKKGNNVEEAKLHIFYRTSDAGYPKEKPEYINMINCLRNALIQFPVSKVDWNLMCDNCCEETMTKIYELWDEFGCDRNKIYRVSVGHGAGTFRLVYEMATELEDNDIVYFLENDYLHRNGSLNALLNVFKNNEIDYATLYDHPDKYELDYRYSYLYDRTRVFYIDGVFWQKIPTTTMTFAAKVKTIKRDKKIFWRWTSTKHPYDTYIFIELLRRIMVSPMPGYSTHGETKYLSPSIDWKEVQKNNG